MHPWLIILSLRWGRAFWQWGHMTDKRAERDWRKSHRKIPPQRHPQTPTSFLQLGVSYQCWHHFCKQHPTSKNTALISKSHNASPLGSKCLIQEAAGDYTRFQGGSGGSLVQRTTLQTVKELTGFGSSVPFDGASPQPHFRDTAQLQLLTSGIQLVLFCVCLLSFSTALFFPQASFLKINHWWCC